MTAQAANKVTVPVGSDGWNPVAHIKGAFESAPLCIPVADAAERDGLAARFPGGIIPINTEVTLAADKGFREFWNGTAWKWRPEPRGVAWYGDAIVNSSPINTAETVTKSTGTFTFKGGRRYRLGWQAEYYMDVTGLSFQLKISTAASGDAAGAITGLSPVCYHTIQSTASAAATEFFNMQSIYEPASDLTVQLKFSVVKVSGGGGSVFLVGNAGRRIEYFIEDLGTV